jgi:arylsulfatase A-like enzyme
LGGKIMNIIYMHTHDTGRYIEPYGYNVPTPNLMELAKEGTVFRQAFCVGPTCSPSRAGLLSGMAPHSCGMLGLAHRGFHMDCSKHLVRFLNDKGYETALSGIQHEMPEAGMIGYKRILDNQNYHMRKGLKFDSVQFDLDNAHFAADFIKEKKDKPFFMSFGMFNTHRAFPDIDSDINPDYIQPPWPHYDNKENREEMAAYITSARVMDRCAGIIMEALKESGQDEDTMIIFTTDHGIPFPKMKCSLYDVGIGVSLIIKFPGNKMRGGVLDSLVSQVDIFPTICDFAGLDKPNGLQGVSLLPLFEGTTDKVREEIFAEVNYHAAYEPVRCIRTERYKLIRFYGNHNELIPANWDDGLSKSFLVENGYLGEIRDREMLFDLYLDPVERINHIGDNRYRDIYNDLSLRLEEWMRRTEDPLFAPKIPAPEGAIVNTRSCISPGEDSFE